MNLKNYHSALAGKVMPFLSNFYISREEFNDISNALLKSAHWGDLFVLSILGWATVPSCHFLYLLYSAALSPYPGRFVNMSEEEKKEKKRNYRDSYLFQIADHVGQAARLALVVYGIDCLAISLGAIGALRFQQLSKLSQATAKIIYTFWAVRRMQAFKRYLIGKAFARKPDKLGKASVIDRLLDGILYGAALLLALDYLSVEMGIALTSLFAFGSAGTLVLSLASKDIAAMFVNGLVLSTSEKMYEGDAVRFGDGTEGVVTKIGWLDTTIRHWDERIAVVPNSQLGMQRVYNISRVSKCQVVQKLRFHYKDVDKFPKLCADIKDEIVKSCPKLITDGTRPFRAFWTDYREDFLEVTVTAHFDLPPVGDVFLTNKQNMLQAINRAVKKNDVQFVTTFYPQPLQN